MFEKEAEEYAQDMAKYYESALDSIPSQFEMYLRKAVEYGYNKANEWHKDLPTEDVDLAIIEVEDCGYLLCEYRKGVWYNNGSSAVCEDWITRNIKRWKEIVLPEPPKYWDLSTGENNINKENE